MKFHRATLDDCADTVGAAVVIDVLRAFTTAAYALAGGASKIALVSTVEEAFGLRGRFPDCFLTGEVGGLPPPGFDLGNSPAALEGMDLTGRTLVQRTTAGTQGVTRCLRADPIYVSGFATARATAERLRALAPEKITFVATGVGPEAEGDADLALADYLEALLRSPSPDGGAGAPGLDARPYLERVRRSTHGRRFTLPMGSASPAADLACAMRVDRFDFAMRVRRTEGLLLVEKA
ncbi:MAG: 2-phosphosulfolactate phosphatase [Spirochaetes bacterium]|nr:2-phosphosulfolactate phosphatase [Spirochaetota bacterium]